MNPCPYRAYTMVSARPSSLEMKGRFVRSIHFLTGIALLILSCALVGCADTTSELTRYEIKDDAVIYKSPWGPRPVTDADPETFKTLSGAHGVDKTKVFFGADVVVGADPASFVVLDFHTGRDSRSIYRATTRCDECDPATFKSLDKGEWYVDKDAAYTALNDGWKRIPNVDTQSFKPLNKWFAKDSQSVFLNSRRVAGADSATFKLASCGKCEVCGEDKNRCYWFEHAVPCDCKPHSGKEFPSGMTQAIAGKAVLDVTAPASFASPIKGMMSFGYLVAEPGMHTLNFKCWDSVAKSSISSTLAMHLEANRFYRFRRKDGTKCEIDVEHPAIVQGRNERHAIYIQADKAQLQLKLNPGVHTLQVVCREVTRAGIFEVSQKIQADLKPGVIYRLDGISEPTANRCEIHTRPLSVQ